eukprot:CAMPEP_0179302018 /NCGR_PEP_ID=MMETSP0797-20121207/47847_1 /TAXON_ID=47934 /ORGANISM="Dinophysis acuminata, Strain DAEP01" /LENGTH=87 /DNA_ID=CAMNT_0021011533 /DNA_START=20 /DNA_END=280 /DNA_ORIENTATION=-
MPRSVTPTSLYFFMITWMASLPFFRSSSLRYTGAYFCIDTWSSLRSSIVGTGPLAFRTESSRARVLSPALAGIATGGLLGFTSSAVV